MPPPEDSPEASLDAPPPPAGALDDSPPHAPRPLPAGEEGFRALAAALPQMIWVSGAKGGVQYISPKWIAFTGRPEADLLGTGFQECIHPDDRAEIGKRRADPDRGTAAVNPPVEFRLRRHDGEYRHIEATVDYLRDEAGEIQGVVGSAVDVTELRADATLAREQQEQLRAAVTATGLARYVYYPHEQKLVGDDRLSEIVGVSVGDLMTREGLRGVIGMIHPDDAAVVEAAIQAALDGGPDYDVTYRIDRPAGDGTVEERWLAARGVAQVDDGPLRMVGVVEDITDRVHEEEHRLQVQKREAIGTLASGIAHDFNNVLSAILSNASLAEVESAAGASTAESLAEITRAAQRAGDMVRRLLDASREEEPAAVPFDLAGVVEEACSLVGPSLPPSVALRREIAPGLPPLVGDATQLHQVAMNLITNAGHAASDGGGTITVTVEQLDGGLASAPGAPFTPGPHLALRVTDDGEGMSQALIARVFDPFFTTKPAGEGTGLGLTVSQRIARNHGGDIRIDSELGVGTTVNVYLPIPAGVVALADAPSQDGSGGASAGEHPVRVLFVDDELALVRLARRALPMAGYAVDAFDRPTEALDHLRGDLFAVDIVVTELSMPGLTGLELIAHVRKLRPD
ncbi:MAG: ATP-binding protein, partial [Solirubrobacteraceae bacterium]